MNIQITSPYGVKLLTANTRLEEDITATIDKSLLPSGELTVTENGTYDVYNKETVNVNVPIPDGYIQPSGNLDITENGSYNIADKASATVNVQSGLTINGIIEQYKVQAGKTVNAGDFVEFVNAVSWGSGTFNSGNTKEMSACKLNDNSVLVAYQDGGNSTYGTAVVLTINATSVLVGTKVVFSSVKTSKISVVALSESKVLVAYNASSNGKAIVLSISGTTITVGTEVAFNSKSVHSPSAVVLNENKVLVAYQHSTVSYNAVVLSISGTTITVGTAQTLDTLDETGVSTLSAVALSESKVLVAYENYGNSQYGTAVVLSVSGTTISVGTNTVFNSATTQNVLAVALSESKVLVAYYASSNSNAMVLTVDGSAITVGTETAFDSGSMNYNSVCKLNENKVLITYQDGGNSVYGATQVLTIDGATITAGAKTIFNSADTYEIACIAFSSTSAVVFYNNLSNGYYKGLTIDGTTITSNTTTQNETLVLPSETVINGIANTSGTTGETVEVYVPIPKGYTVTLIFAWSGNNAGAENYSVPYTANNGESGEISLANANVTLTNITSLVLDLPNAYSSITSSTTGILSSVVGENIIEITEDQTITVYVANGVGGGND